MARLGHVESLRSSFSENLHIPLHGDHRYSEGLHDLLRLHRAVDDHLAGEHAEAIHIVLAVVKHRQVTVDVIDSARFLFHRNLAIDLGYAGRKYGELQLWHPSLLPEGHLLGNPFQDHSSFPGRHNLLGEIRSSDLLLVLCVHAAKHVWRRLSWVRGPGT